MTVHRDALSGQVARTAWAGPGTFTLAAWGDGPTSIVGQAKRCLQMGPIGGKSGSPDIGRGRPSRRRIGDRCWGARTPPDRAGIPDRAATVRGPQPPLDRPGMPDRYRATREPSRCFGTNERDGLSGGRERPPTSKEASGMREGPRRGKGGLTDWKVFPAGRVDLGRDDLGRRARGGRRAALARWRRDSAGKDGSRTYDVPSDLRERGRESPNLWYTLKGASPSLCTAHASVSPSSSGGVVARAVPVSGP
jgi:hypothetical protein